MPDDPTITVVMECFERLSNKQDTINKSMLECIQLITNKIRALEAKAAELTDTCERLEKRINLHVERMDIHQSQISELTTFMHQTKHGNLPAFKQPVL